MPLVVAQNIAKRFDNGPSAVDVLTSVNFSLEEGEQLAIFGASGSGKSTLLHVLGGLDRPTRGEVLFEGRPLSRLGERDIASLHNRSIGFVFQFFHLLSEFTALENVMIPCLIGGVSKREALERASHLLEDVGLKDRIHHRPSELSGGEQQRVALARAMVMEPKLLLADEPTGNLDRESGDRVWQQMVGEVVKRKMGLVVVTHNPELLGRVPRRLELKDGEVREVFT